MSLSSLTRINGRNGLLISIVTVVALITLFLPKWITANQTLSPVAGLVTQKALAQQSIDYDTALANGKPTFIEFYADWCTTCQAFAPTLQQVHTQLGEQVNFVMLDIDNPQWKEQIQTFKATGVPQLTLLDTDHTLVETWIGKVPPSILLDSAETLLS